MYQLIIKPAVAVKLEYDGGNYIKTLAADTWLLVSPLH